MASPGGPFRRLLFDPDYWTPRLRRLADEPRYLVQMPRPDLGRPGIEVLELRLRASDGARQKALLARSAFHKSGGEIHLRVCGDLETSALDWQAVGRGATDVVVHLPTERKLEDRVLDVLRWTEAASSVESVEGRSVAYVSGQVRPPDELLLADHLRSQGLV